MQASTKEFGTHEIEEILIEEKENWITWDEMDKIKYTTLISIASNIGTLLSHPFYVLTTRQQVGHLSGDKIVSNSLKEKSMNTAFREALVKIGWRGLFRGYIPLALLNTPSSIAYLAVTESSRQEFRSAVFRHYPDCPVTYVDVSQAVLSATLANFVSVILYTPAEVVSTIMVVQNVENRLSLTQTMKQLYRQDGPSAFFRGFNSNLAYGVLCSTIWWWAYMVCRRSTPSFVDPKRHNFIIDSVSGLTAGVVSTVVVHPLDTIRARIMAGTYEDMKRPPGMIKGMMDVVKAEGAKALWRGLYPSVCATALSSTIFAFTYEFIKRAASLPDDMPDLG